MAILSDDSRLFSFAAPPELAAMLRERRSQRGSSMAFRRMAMIAAVSERLRLAGASIVSGCGSEISWTGSGVDLVRVQSHFLACILVVTRS